MTVGVDTQDDRLEAEFVAWGRDAESWSIEYLVFWGDTADLNSEAWQGLHKALNEKHAGLIVNACLIDEGGHRTEQTRLFCEGFRAYCLPVAGSPGAEGKPGASSRGARSPAIGYRRSP